MSDINLKFYHHIPPAIYIVPHPDTYDISTSDARLRISKGDLGAVIWDSLDNDGVSIEQVELNIAIVYADGRRLEQGTLVYAILVKPVTNYSELLTQVSENKYQYSLTVDEDLVGGWTIQGNWIISPETGLANIGVYTDQLGVIKTVDYVAAIVAGGTGPQGIQGVQGIQGMQGIQGPAGPWEITPEFVTTSKVLDTGKGFYSLEAAGNDIVVTLPDPSLYFDGINADLLTISRKIGDTTGTAGIAGTGIIGTFYLYQQESVVAISNGTSWELHNAGPDIALPGSGDATPRYAKLSFDFSDLATGKVLISTLTRITLISEAVARITTAFDGVRFLIGQDTEKYEIASAENAEIFEEYLIKPYAEFNGDVFLYAEFTISPTVGAGEIFLILS